MSTAIIKNSIAYHSDMDAFTNIDIRKRKALEGKVFLGFVKYTIGVGATENVQIKTGSSGVCFYVSGIATDSDKITLKLYENPTITDGTTTINLTNMNRESSNTVDVTAYSDPTNVSGGTQLDEFYAGGTFGQKVVAGEQIGLQEPFRMAANTDYIISITNDGSTESTVLFRFLIIED